MSYTFTYVKHYKRGAKWEDGSTRTCTRCRYEGSRAKQAVITAFMRYAGTRLVSGPGIPVAYCDNPQHIPAQLRDYMEESE